MPAQFGESQLLAMIAGVAWPFLRVGALFLAIPVFTGHMVPVRVRVMLAASITWLIAPTLPAMPDAALFSLSGFWIAVQQCLIGLSIGFALHLVFEAIVFGGQSIAYSMGLGFASMIDPQTGVQVPVIARFYQILATLLFLALDGHLVLIRLLVDSFQILPVGFEGLSADGMRRLALWASRSFAAGVLLSLPLVTALLLVNLGFGVASRAAPQLNIFSVGFPISLGLGLFLIGISLPDVLGLFSGFLDEGYRLMSEILR
ncbi:flagellar biosynthetic protein FliR [Methylocaldum sp. MU1018]